MDTDIPVKREATDTPDGVASSERAWHTLSVEEVARHLQTDTEWGLTGDEAARRRERYGPNVLAESAGRSALSIFAAQFKSLIVALLLAATLVSFVLGDTVEGSAILAVIVLNAAVGFWTEWRAEQALTALQKQTVTTAHVVRDGEPRQVPAASSKRRLPLGDVSTTRPPSST